MDKPRIIGIRVQPDEYERLDNLRHTHKTTWQGLVLDFLRQWADAGSTARSAPTERIPSATAVEIPSSFTKEDRDTVETFIEMLATDRVRLGHFCLYSSYGGATTQSGSRRPADTERDK